MKDVKTDTIVLASDHAGFDKKQLIIKHLKEKGIPFKDMGCYSSESCDYPEFGHLLGEAIDNGDYQTGISFCGSGQGINMTVNKHQNVRSALCWSPEIAILSKQHNNANVCAIPSRFLSDEETIKIVDAFLAGKFEGGRHARRIVKIPIK